LAAVVPTREEVRETAALIGWLRDHPEERSILLWLCEHELADPTLTAEREEEINRFAGACHYRVCSCGTAVVAFPNGVALSWPELAPHGCASVEKPGRRETVPPSVRVPAPKVLQE
jgi:hypothetical protein